MSARSLTDALRETLALFDEPGAPLTTTEAADRLDLGRRSTYERLDRLADRDEIETKKVGSNGRVWWRSAPDESGTTDQQRRGRATGRERDGLGSELDEVYDRITDGFYGLDDELRFTYLNDRAQGLLGLDGSTAIGADVREELSLTDRFESALKEAVDEGHPVFLEDHYEPLDTWFENALYPSETGVSVYFRDVSERKERERELERYGAIVDAMGDAVYALDPRGRFTFVNRALADRSGYDESELLGEHVSIGMPREAIDRTAAAMADLLAEDPDGSTRVEFEVETEEGERIPVENHISLLTDESGTFRGSAGVLRDVSERQARERELEESRNRYQALVENFPNGSVALVDDDLRYLTVGGVPIERAGATVEEFEGNRLPEIHPSEIADVLVPRYEEALAGEPSTFETEIGGRFHQFRILPVRNDDDEIFAALGMSQDVTDRVEHQRALERQRERLTALDELNGVFRDITEAVIERSTREEVEEIVCERLADSDSYSFAWIGDVDVPTQTVDLRTEAGVEGYLDDVTISVDPDDERSRGPAGRALLDREIQTSQEAGDDDRLDPWRDHVRDHSFRSSAAVPIVHDDTLYGVLNVFAERPQAFTGDERAVIDQLGEVVGHAIAAVEQKRALASDEVVEIEFRIPDGVYEFDLPSIGDGELVFERTVPVGDDTYLAYGHVDDDMVDVLDAMVEAIPRWDSMRLFGDEASRDGRRFELHLVEPPIISTVTALGGYVDRATIDGGDYYMRIHLAPSADARQLIDFVRETHPSARLVSRHQISGRPDTPVPFSAALDRRLTDRQRAALESAYFAGYFEWPRDSTGEDVARSLGITSATFHQHLRTATRELIHVALEEATSA